MLRYRLACPDDHEDIINLYRASVFGLGSDDYTDRQLNAWASFPGIDAFPYTDPDHFIAVVETNNPEVPLAAMNHLNAQTGTLLKHYVHPEYTRQGIGSELLELAERVAADHGSGSIYLDAALPGVEFYDANGYEQVTDIRKRIEYEGTTVTIKQIVMTKDLPDDIESSPFTGKFGVGEAHTDENDDGLDKPW